MHQDCKACHRWLPPTHASSSSAASLASNHSKSKRITAIRKTTFGNSFFLFFLKVFRPLAGKKCARAAMKNVVNSCSRTASAAGMCMPVASAQAHSMPRFATQNSTISQASKNCAQSSKPLHTTAVKAMRMPNTRKPSACLSTSFPPAAPPMRLGALNASSSLGILHFLRI